MKPYQPVVASLLNQARPAAILDAPSGSGWLKDLLVFEAAVDGLDLFAVAPPRYRSFQQADLDLGLPQDSGCYEAIVCCEGIEHFGNPALFFRTAHEHLTPDGLFIVTTPNVWFPQARLQYLMRGFFPSFPCLAGRIRRGTHMHVMPWSFPQLYLYLSLQGFVEITLHDIPDPKPKLFHERFVGWPQTVYCRRKANAAQTEEERRFWAMAGSAQSIYGRHLVVSARTPRRSPCRETALQQGQPPVC